MLSKLWCVFLPRAFHRPTPSFGSLLPVRLAHTWQNHEPFSPHKQEGKCSALSLSPLPLCTNSKLRLAFDWYSGMTVKNLAQPSKKMPASVIT